MKKFHIQTFGCAMNVYDGQRIANMLTRRGWTSTDDVGTADLIILNTCSVREKATNKVFSSLGRIRLRKKSDAIFGIVGCVAREAGADAFRRIPELNFVLGPQSYHKLPEILDNPDTKLLNIDLSGLEKFDELPRMESSPAVAYIPITEGCDHVCTYCIVPYTRGREVSRPYDDVMNDVIHAAQTGAVEICFLGQNVNGYRASRDSQCGMWSVECGVNDKNNNSTQSTPYYTLTNLIRATAALPQIKRIRFTSSYPTEMTDDLIDLFRTEPKLLPFLNMPIQSGSPNVLTRMNRPYSLELYIDIIQKLRTARPDIQISSDFIVGFPGETDEDFKHTMDIIERARYINSYSFKYSPRPHTAAALMSDQIPENIKQERLKIVDGKLNDLQRKFNTECIGKVFECLCEGSDKSGNNSLFRTPYMQQCIVQNMRCKAGTIMNLEITDANKSSLRGKIIEFPHTI